MRSETCEARRLGRVVGYSRHVSAGASRGGARVRSAELVAALCLASDLGMGFPFEHGLHTTLIAMRLADRLGVDGEEVGTDLLRVSPLPFGLHHGRARHPEVFGDSLTARSILSGTGQAAKS